MLQSLNNLSRYLLLWGIPGLLAIAFLDSAALPIIGGPDAIVLLLAWQRPAHIFFIILAAAAGSTLGCLVLYNVGRAGGEIGLARFSPERRAWVKQKLDHNASVAVMAASTAPPPFPTKLVILAAGAFRVRQTKFLYGVLVGRLTRYSLVAIVGARFGNEAAEVLRRHYPIFTAILVAALVLFFLVRRYRGKVRATNSG